MGPQHRHPVQGQDPGGAGQRPRPVGGAHGHQPVPVARRVDPVADPAGAGRVGQQLQLLGQLLGVHRGQGRQVRAGQAAQQPGRLAGQGRAGRLDPDGQGLRVPWGRRPAPLQHVQDPRGQVGDQRPLPVVPGRRAGGQPVGHGQQVEQAQAARRPERRGHALDHAGVVEVAPGRRLDQEQVVADEHRHLLELVGVHAHAGQGPAGQQLPGDAVVGARPLADVVEDRRQVERVQVAGGLGRLGGPLVLLQQPGHLGRGGEGVAVDGVAVPRVVLDPAAHRGPLRQQHRPAADVVEQLAGAHSLRAAQDGHERGPQRLRPGLQRRPVEGLLQPGQGGAGDLAPGARPGGQQPHGQQHLSLRVGRRLQVACGQRRALHPALGYPPRRGPSIGGWRTSAPRVGCVDDQQPVLQPDAARLEAADQAGAARAAEQPLGQGPGLDRGQVLDRPGGGVHRRHQPVGAVVAVEAEGLGHGRLEVGPDPVVLASRLAVQRLADGQQQLPGPNQLGPPGRPGPAGDRGQPADGVQVAQPADVLLEVGGEHPAGPLDPQVPLGGHLEQPPGQPAAVPLQPAPAPAGHLVHQPGRAGHQPGLEQRGRRLQVAPGPLDRLLGRADGVAHLEAGVPQRVQQAAEVLGAGPALVVDQHQQVDVGVGRHIAPPVATDGNHGDAAAGQGHGADQLGQDVVEGGRPAPGRPAALAQRQLRRRPDRGELDGARPSLRGARHEPPGPPQSASPPISPVRMRSVCSTLSTQTLPSPIEPVRAPSTIALTTSSTASSSVRTSTLVLGSSSTWYSAPR